MDKNQLISETKSKLAAATDHFRQEIDKIRTGRAHPGMLDNVMVEAYGQTMPLKAVASITTPEPQLLQITPFDPSNLQAISEAISKDESLGLNPADDGRVVRIAETIQFRYTSDLFRLWERIGDLRYNEYEAEYRAFITNLGP